ncbi:MAG: MotA/TolQ/ExbB proton channel family protein [Proteobacteria bacterium]|nr:MotA/TolQ/ExbB proton channel family protein [Pseudomonadota bacterium]
MKEVFEFLARGGVIMIPIALGSVIALTIFLERIWSLQETRILPRDLLNRVLDAARGGDIKAAREECLKSNTPLGRLLLAGLDIKGLSRNETKGILEEVGRREVTRMERYIEAMGTTASVEPLLGLLGTVVGMIQVFQKVVVTSREGAVDPGQLANGIWQALITTAAGLSVAIVAFIGYRYLLSRSNRYTIEMEEGTLKLVEILCPVNKKEESD